MGNERRLAAFNGAAMVAIITASITNLYLKTESFGAYLPAYALLILIIPILPRAWAMLRSRFEKFDLFAAAFVLTTTVAAVVNPNEKSPTYVLLYAFSTLFLAVILRNALAIWGNRRLLHGANAVTVFAVGILAIVEFWTRYLSGWSPIEWLPLANPPVALCGIDLPRAYALSLEPTYLAWYLNTLGLVAVWWVGRSQIVRPAKLLYAIVWLSAEIVTWSTAGWVCLFAGGVIAGLLALAFDRRSAVTWLRQSPRWAGDVLLVVLVACAPIVIAVPQSRLLPCLGYATSKVSTVPEGSRTLLEVRAEKQQLEAALSKATNASEILRLRAQLIAIENELSQLTSPDPKTGMSRTQIWKIDIARGIKKPLLGWGPGYNSSQGETSSLSVFVAVFEEQGILALLLYVGFLFGIGWRILRSGTPAKYLFLAAYSGGVIHMMSQTKFFHPCLWLVVGLFWIEAAAATKARGTMEEN